MAIGATASGSRLNKGFERDVGRPFGAVSHSASESAVATSDWITIPENWSPFAAMQSVPHSGGGNGWADHRGIAEGKVAS